MIINKKDNPEIYKVIDDTIDVFLENKKVCENPYYNEKELYCSIRVEYFNQLQQENERLNDNLEKVKFTLNLIEPEYLKLKKEKQELIELCEQIIENNKFSYLGCADSQYYATIENTIVNKFLNKLEGKE